MKAFTYSLGCMLAWLVFMPIVVIGGGIGLFVYAAFAELTQFLVGSTDKRPDPSTARAIAAKICFDNSPRRVAFGYRSL